MKKKVMGNLIGLVEAKKKSEMRDKEKGDGQLDRSSRGKEESEM